MYHALLYIVLIIRVADVDVDVFSDVIVKAEQSFSISPGTNGSLELRTRYFDSMEVVTEPVPNKKK